MSEGVTRVSIVQDIVSYTDLLISSDPKSSSGWCTGTDVADTHLECKVKWSHAMSRPHQFSAVRLDVSTWGMAQEGQQDRGNDGEGRSFELIWTVHGIQMSHVLVTGPLMGHRRAYWISCDAKIKTPATPLTETGHVWIRCLLQVIFREKHTQPWRVMQAAVSLPLCTCWYEHYTSRYQHLAYNITDSRSVPGELLPPLDINQEEGLVADRKSVV